MKNFRFTTFSVCARAASVLLIVGAIFTLSAYSQDYPANIANVAHLETLPSGTIVIPMDSKQNVTVSGTTRFNLKVYGLIQELLWNNIPVKWAINRNKTTNGSGDSTSIDFTAVAKLDGAAGSGSSTDFRGGTFVIPQGYESIARQVITAFKTQTPVNDASDTRASSLQIYVTTQSTSNVDIRYTIVHKPQVGIGQNNGVSSGVHQKLYDFSMIKHYANIDNNTINGTSCYTIATQPHFDQPNFINNFNQFLSSGGNLLLQCLSITTFENNASGHYQTTTGWTGFANGTSGLTSTPGLSNFNMPFTQFLGSIPGDPTGQVSDYNLPSGGGTHNNFFKVADNSPGQATTYVATEGVVPTTGGVAGGAVFEIGGHDYFQDGVGNSASNSQYNGQRMILNALFVPVTRPPQCGLLVPTLGAYKAVQLLAADDVNHNGLVNINDKLTWTIVYVNTSLVDIPAGFQVTDLIDTTKNAYVPGTLSVTVANGAVGAANGSYNGTSNTNFLAAGATLPHDTGSGAGRITITFKTQVTASTGVILNQTNATGTNVAASQATSDTLDQNTAGIQTVQGGVTPPGGGGLIAQVQQTSGVDPTRAVIQSPTAAQASITGSVRSSTGLGILRAKITVVDPATGETKTAFSNVFGAFTVNGIEVGKLYSVSVSHPNYTFDTATQSFVLNEDVSGLVFVANPPPTRRPPGTSATNAADTLSRGKLN